MIELQRLKPIISFDVTLLGLNWYRDKDPQIPLGLAVVGSYLLEHVDFIDEASLKFVNCDVRENLSTVIHEILIQDPRVLGIGVYVWNTNAVKQVITGLRELGFTGRIVLGGPEITYDNADAKNKYHAADYFVKGDGELAFLNIVLYESSSFVDLGDGIFRHSSTEFSSFAKISSERMISPFQNARIRDSLFGNSNSGFTRWQTQRGCFYRCSFCAFPNGYHSMYEMELDIVKKDLILFKEFGVKEVAVLDPIFFVHKERAKKILNMMSEICPKVRFEIQTKLEHLDDELIDLISSLNIVLECGVQTLDPLVQKVVKRRNNLQRMETTLEKLVRQGVLFEVHLIYGLPFQTIESLKRDFALLSKYTDEIRLFPLIRLIGTGLDLSLDGADLLFSSIFPREVIQTKWIDRETIFCLKRLGNSYF